MSVTVRRTHRTHKSRGETNLGSHLPRSTFVEMKVNIRGAGICCLSTLLISVLSLSGEAVAAPGEIKNIDLMGMASFMQKYENESKIVYYENIVKAWNYNVDTSKKNLKLMVNAVK